MSENKYKTATDDSSTMSTSTGTEPGSEDYSEESPQENDIAPEPQEQTPEPNMQQSLYTPAQAQPQPIANATTQQPTAQPAVQQQPAQPLDGQIPVSNIPTWKNVQDALTQDDNSHMQDLINYAGDLANKQITPKHYSDFFADKGTLGKIGTALALFASSIGSSLTHTANPLLAMMDKEIERDLHQQETNQQNARSFYNIAQNMKYNRVNQRLAALNIVPNAANIGADAAGKIASLPAIGAGSQAKAYMYTSMLNDLQDAVGRSNNPQIQNFFNANVAPYLQQRATSYMQQANMEHNNAAQGIGQSLQSHEAKKSEGAQNQFQGVDTDKMNKIITNGTNAQTLGTAIDVPGKIATPATAAAMQKEAPLVQNSREVMKQYVDVFKELSNKALHGKINPQDYNALVEPLINRFAALSGVRNGAEYENLKKAFFPTAVQWGDTAKNQFKSGINHFRMLESGNTNNLQRMGVYSPVPDLSYENTVKGKKGAKGQGSAQENLQLIKYNQPKNGDTAVDRNGNPIIFSTSDGKWHRDNTRSKLELTSMEQ